MHKCNSIYFLVHVVQFVLDHASKLVLIGIRAALATGTAATVPVSPFTILTLSAVLGLRLHIVFLALAVVHLQWRVLGLRGRRELDLVNHCGLKDWEIVGYI